MTEKFEIFYNDLTPEAQINLLAKIMPSGINHNWDVFPLAVMEWEVDEGEKTKGG